MRKGIIAVILIAATYFVFPQDATAADLPPGKPQTQAPSAYEILGVKPVDGGFPVFGSQAELESRSGSDSVLPVQLETPPEEQATDLTPASEKATEEPPATELATEVAPAEAEQEATPAEVDQEATPAEVDQEVTPLVSPVPPLEEALEEPVEEIPAEIPEETLEEPIAEPAEEPLVEERTVPEEETGLAETEAGADDADLAEPGEDPTSTILPAALQEASEEALVAEILRLMDERDQLNQTISGLKQENELLSGKAEQTAYYQDLAETLERRIAELEAQLADTELALADSAEALLLAESNLAEQSTTIEELESALAVSETSLKDTRTYLDLLRDELAATPEETGAADVSAIAGEAAGDGRLGALAAERDAALEARTKAEAARRAAEEARTAAELSRAATEAVLAEALATGLVTVAPGQGSPEAVNGYLSGWSLDTARFTQVIRPDLSDSAARMGSWLVQGAAAKQTDPSQYFSRLELPLAQDGKPLLYSFKARATGKGWVGLGLHFFVEDVVKRRGYGEGKSLLIWFTRDQGARGVDTTYLQLYRSDNDVVMERMFDAAIGDSIADWRTVDLVYDPAAEYVAVSVDGVLRIVYKTFFGRTSGATIALRTLGGGVEFADFSVRGE